MGQKRLTNIAVVRLKKNGLRFEIACYKNKVGDWRAGIEKDLDEVLQTETVFSNVGKGVLARDKDLQAAFGRTDHKAIALEILAKGELQVSDKERKSDYDNLFKDVATLLSEKCVNPDTNRPYTITMLERALRDIHFNIDVKKNAKQLMLEAIPQLKEKFPIERARMQLRIQTPSEAEEQLRSQLQEWDAITQSAETRDGWFHTTVQVDPGLFRDIHQLLATLTSGKGRLEVLNLAVMNEAASTDEFSLASSRPSMAPTFPTAAPVSDPAAPSTSYSAAQPAAAPRPLARGRPEASSGGTVICARGPIASLPEEHASRRERFAELDTLQAGWEVELVSKGSTVEAVFYSPDGERVGPYAAARRAALQAHKQAAAQSG